MTFEEQSYLLTNGMYTTVAVESVAKPDTKDYDGPTGVVQVKGRVVHAQRRDLGVFVQRRAH